MVAGQQYNAFASGALSGNDVTHVLPAAAALKENLPLYRTRDNEQPIIAKAEKTKKKSFKLR